MEFDWWERGRDFRADMWRGKATLAQIAGRIRLLPAGSAFGRARREYPDWSDLHELVASLNDALWAVNWRPNPADKGKPEPAWEPPPRVPRPWDVPPEVTARAEAEAIEQHVAGFRARRAKQRG